MASDIQDLGVHLLVLGLVSFYSGITYPMDFAHIVASGCACVVIALSQLERSC